MKHTIFLLFSALFTVPAFCQDSLNTSPKWELGIDLISPFRKPRFDQLNATYGLIVKKKTRHSGALRFRTNMGWEYMPDPMIKGINQPREYSLNFDFGYEKQRRIKRFVHYYGVDGMIRFYRLNSVIGVGIAPGTTFTRDKSKVNTIGLAVFSGGKYFIAERISIALETSITLDYSKIIEDITDLNSMGQPISEPIRFFDTNGIEARINPISVIYLSYYF